MATDELLRMRDVCARTGLARSTIHHYIREGVLPKPTKTGRNTAYYDEAFVRRVQLIKTLQEKTHMPLATIRETLNDMPASVGPVDLEHFEGVTATIADSLRHSSEQEVSRTELLSLTGLKPIELDGIAAVKLIDPISRGNKTYYSPLDARIVHAIARLRAAGATHERGFAGSTELVHAYRKHLTELARVEAKEMTRMLGPLAGLDVEAFVQRSTEPLGDLINAIHRKALVQAVTDIVTTRGGKNGRTRK